MSQTIQLIPMLCIRCQAPLPAQPDEVAWACPTCGQGMQLSDETGLTGLDIHYSAGIKPNTTGKPFWVTQGTAQLTRKTFRGNQTQEMIAFWQQPRIFYVPAFNMPLDQVIQTGVQFLRQPIPLQPGSPAPFLPVTVLPADVRPLAEFILIEIEADRKDLLRELQFDLQLSIPQLWIFP